MFRSRKVNQSINDLDTYMAHLDECSLVFKNGVKHFLDGSSEEFQDNLKTMTQLRDTTTELRRNIENEFYSLSMLSENRVDLMQLLERLDRIADLLFKNLWQYEIEVPFFPAEMTVDFLKLIEISSLAVEGSVEAAKNFFREPRHITEKVHRIYYFEKEVMKQAQTLKRQVFHEMENLKLSQKFNLRSFTLHVEELAEEAVKVADLLSIMVIKQNN
jgi:predicted phosphate transport protein (TIGR00153 family)